MKLSSTNKSAFTLIELLVVITIIALLISILMPSLSKARQHARAVVCMANMKSIGTTLQQYIMDSREVLPGPNTSGKKLNDNSFDNGEDYGSSYPTQNMDWMSPMFGKSLGLPKERLERTRQLFENEFRCPENNIDYDYVYGDSESDSSDLFLTGSYCATLGFHLKRTGEAAADEISNSNMISQVRLPGGYRPVYGRVGKPNQKIFALDGSRYVDNNNGTFSFSYNKFAKQIQGGNFMCYGPANQFSGDPFKFDEKPAQYKVLYGINIDVQPTITKGTEKYAYRHNSKLNAVFFDGHVASLTASESLNISQYWPKGSVINNPAATFDPKDYRGQIIK